MLSIRASSVGGRPGTYARMLPGSAGGEFSQGSSARHVGRHRNVSVGRTFLQVFASASGGLGHLSSGPLRRKGALSLGTSLRKNLMYYSLLHNFACASGSLQASALSGKTSSPGISSREFSSGKSNRSGVSPDAASKPSVSVGTASKSNELDFYIGGAMYPSVEKTNGGEDSYFISSKGADNTMHSSNESTAGEPGDSVKGHGYCFMGVSDGVGGWADMGVNAGEYSRQLMHLSDQMSQEEDANSPNPKRVLYKAAQSCTAKGSATATILSLSNSDENGASLRGANLGDSGFIVVRDTKVAFKSPVQQHSFNFPYQLSTVPKYSDNPMAAETFDLTVAPGDTVVLGTDGLFDNLFPEEIASIVYQAKAKGTKPGELAHILSKIVFEVATDKTRDTPFSYGARQVGFPHEYGGKMDDVTIVVTYIMRDSKM